MISAFGMFVTGSGIQPFSATTPIVTRAKWNAETKLSPDTVVHVYDNEVDDNNHVFLHGVC